MRQSSRDAGGKIALSPAGEHPAAIRGTVTALRTHPRDLQDMIG